MTTANLLSLSGHLSTAESVPVESSAFRYWAFLSYSHQDEPCARWLHRALEGYRIPAGLIGRRTVHCDLVPARLHPIFRDREELTASTDLSSEIRQALSQARCLIVLCSPAAARSRWTDAEIRAFKTAHPEGLVFGLILAGEPFASEVPGKSDEECLPPALRQRFDAAGRCTGERTEPLAADLRPEGDGRRLALLKLIAGMLGVRLDDLVQRDAQRRQKRFALAAAVSMAGMATTSGLAVMAVQSREEAVQQRADAESLIEFMIGDLRAKLEPAGRLDAMDSLGTRALAYYSAQRPSRLNADGLGRRSRALHLIGEIANLRGDVAGAHARFREAAISTAEALARSPNDPQRIFDHSQSAFWVGYAAWQAGELVEAERWFSKYRDLALRLVEIDPTNLDWQAELGFAHSNLGTLLLDQDRPEAASKAFERSLSLALRLALREPVNTQRADAVASARAWLADSLERQGSFAAAAAQRAQQLEHLNSVLENDPLNATAHRSIVVANLALARLALAQGDTASATTRARAAVEIAERQAGPEPENMLWRELQSSAYAELAETAIAAGDRPTAMASVGRTRLITATLRTDQRQKLKWPSIHESRARIMVAQLASEERRYSEALDHAVAAVHSLSGLDINRDAAARRQLTASLIEQGNALAALGRGGEARLAWSTAAALPGSADEADPRLVALKMIAHRRLGRVEEAGRLSNKLDAIKFRHPSLMRAARGD